MSRKHRTSRGLLAGVALGGLAFWLIRRRSEHGQEAIEPARDSSDSWLPDDVLDLPPDASDDALLAEIFDRPRH